MATGTIAGKWILKSIEGLDDFAKDFASKIPQEELHSIEYEKKDGGKCVQTSLFGNNFLQALFLMDYGPQEFTHAKEFTHKDLSGSDSKSTILALDGEDGSGAVIQTQTFGEGTDNVYYLFTSREFKGDKMTTKMGYEGKNKDGVKDKRDDGVIAEFERVK